MKLFLAGTESVYSELRPYIQNVKYILQSFYYVNSWQLPMLANRPRESILLDSGAFTFMNTCKGKVNFEEYLDRYIDFINSNDIKYFFELDIDSVVGYPEVLRMRKKLEEGTKKKCIPVWHKSRGIKEFEKMCDEYDYVAIGGLVTKEIKPKEYGYLKWFTNLAHSKNCLIHGLGFTGKRALKYGFDSVDSTSWKTASRFGNFYKFDGTKIIDIAKKNHRLKKEVYITVEKNNLDEWIKYQKYLDNLSDYSKLMR